MTEGTHTTITTGDLVAEVVAFVRSERAPIAPEAVAKDLVLLGALPGAIWIRADFAQWIAAIDTAIKSGSLIEVDKKVQLPLPTIEPETKPSTQMELFE